MKELSERYLAICDSIKSLRRTQKEIYQQLKDTPEFEAMKTIRINELAEQRLEISDVNRMAWRDGFLVSN
jgi:hypothetical protein